METIILNTSKFNFAILLGKVERIINVKGEDKALLSKKEIEMLKHISNIKPTGHNDSVIIDKINLCLSYLN